MRQTGHRLCAEGVHPDGGAGAQVGGFLRRRGCLLCLRERTGRERRLRAGARGAKDNPIEQENPAEQHDTDGTEAEDAHQEPQRHVRVRGRNAAQWGGFAGLAATGTAEQVYARLDNR